jgi:hypothetical protein
LPAAFCIIFGSTTLLALSSLARPTVVLSANHISHIINDHLETFGAGLGYAMHIDANSAFLTHLGVFLVDSTNEFITHFYP